MIQKQEAVAIGWCDNGTTDGKFTEGLMTAVIAGPNNGMKISTSIPQHLCPQRADGIGMKQPLAGLRHKIARYSKNISAIINHKE